MPAADPRLSTRRWPRSLDLKSDLKSIVFFSALALSLLACAQAPSAKTNAARPHQPDSASPGAQYFEQLTRDRQLFDDGKFADAAALYASLTKTYPDDIEVWMRLGNARSKAKQFREAAGALSNAFERGGEYPGNLAYRIARLYGQAGDKSNSLAWLERSLAIPLENRPGIADDEAFAAWRSDERFRELAGLAPKRTASREEAWNYDLDFLVAEIRRMHYAYRSNPLPRAFDDNLHSLRQRIPGLSDSAMEPEVQRLLASLGDGHTGLQSGVPAEIPIAFYDFSDGIFVIDAAADCECIGDRVLALGATPIAAAVQKITPFLSVDNAMGVRLSAPRYLRFPQYLRAAGIAPSDREVLVSLERPGGVKHQYLAKPSNDLRMGRRLFPSRLTATAGPVPRYMQRVNENYWFEVLPGGHTLYFQFNQVFDESGDPIDQFAKRLHAALAPSTIRNLIIDMRHNSGGNLNLFTPLLRSVIAFETSREPAGLYVITSRQTFSAAQVFVNELDRYTSAVFAGEPSGSRPNFIGESAPARLPYSGLETIISTRYHQTDDQDQRMWIAPKIPVALSSADYFANRDPVLDAVLQVIADRTAHPPSGHK
jgi:tetratricopeptide (TPR) repeat protein